MEWKNEKSLLYGIDHLYMKSTMNKNGHSLSFSK